MHRKLNTFSVITSMLSKLVSAKLALTRSFIFKLMSVPAVLQMTQATCKSSKLQALFSPFFDNLSGS